MRMLLFGQDGYFVKKFSEYVSKKLPKHQLFCYTDEEAARRFIAAQKPELILAEEGYLSDCILGGQVLIALSEKTVMPNEMKQGSLNIFQKASGIVDDLIKITSLLSGKSVADGQAKKVMFYSTEGGSGKTSLAYLSSVVSARTRKTAYWNLEPLPFTENLYPSRFNTSMEQCIFMIQNGKTEEAVYNTVMQNEDGVFVMPNIGSYFDYRELSYDILHEICNVFQNMGIEVIVLDLPAGMSSFLDELSEECQRIVWVFSDTMKGNGKEQAFLQDPSLDEWRVKSTLVRNRCASMGRTEDTAICFPNSDSMKNAMRLTDLLRVNPLFENGCNAIVQSFFEQ